MAVLATIHVNRTTKAVTVRRVVNTVRVTQATIRGGVANSLVSPYNSGTKITFEADGGMTIQSPIRITIKNTTTGDEVNYV